MGPRRTLATSLGTTASRVLRQSKIEVGRTTVLCGRGGGEMGVGGWEDVVSWCGWTMTESVGHFIPFGLANVVFSNELELIGA